MMGNVGESDFQYTNTTHGSCTPSPCWQTRPKATTRLVVYLHVYHVCAEWLALRAYRDDEWRAASCMAKY